MLGKRKQARKPAVQRQRPKQRSMSTAKIEEWNRRVAARRREKLKELRTGLRDRSLDHAVISVAKKFARLPFGCITSSCEGHACKELFRRASTRVSLDEIGQEETVFCDGAAFELMLDLSEPAMEFRCALNELKQAFSHPTIGKLMPLVNLVFLHN